MAPTARPTIVCITPVRNEAWILDRFLSCASLWADHIILADQFSTDATRAIAGRYDRVRVIDNPERDYHEGHRQQLLLAAAREIPGPRLILALDADEFLSANYLTSPEWQTALHAAPGTIICFRWANVGPDLLHGWDPEVDFPLGYMDDGTPHGGKAFDSWRIPTPPTATRLLLRQVRVLHYQYTDWQRMKSKSRWYQCWERLRYPERSAVDIFRHFHHMYGVPDRQRLTIAPEWLAGYIDRGIDMTSITQEPTYYWDAQVADYLAEFGPERFAQLDIWWMDWDAVYRRVHNKPPPRPLADPRTPEQKETITWLRATQSRSQDAEVHTREQALKASGW